MTDVKLRFWTVLLGLLIVADSVFTSHVHRTLGAQEGNPLIVWIMNTFNISLDTAMVIRILYCLPLLYVVNKYDWSKFTLFCYLGIYISLTAFWLR